ncbi:MAG TPA: GAF domain-containing protein, partial [Steroidobacteraceae bacterium]|nr:GAF domain-containing protein [Steroidobacteraceae bacterium]
PDGAEPIDQRSCLVVPLVAQRELLGFVYADIEGLSGRFHDGDTQLLSMLAAQAALTLANLRAAEGLERQVAARTAEARTAQSQAEQRAAELAVINSIQQGIAGSLDFDAIVELVGARLCEVLGTDSLGITWIDHEARTCRDLYAVEHGKRLPNFAGPAMSDETWQALLARREPKVLNTSKEVLEDGHVHPGTDLCKSRVVVPIVAGDRRLGGIDMENHEREYAFGESEVRLLETVASSLGVALQSARLFDQTQRLLQETEQRNAELAVINSIQQGMAGSLDFQGIVDLVGDKLCEVLKTGDIGIGWFDHERRVIRHLYAVEHGRRLVLDDETVGDERWARMISLREPVVINTAAENLAHGGHIAGTDLSKSALTVPMVVGDRRIGGITIESHEREYAFSASDVRLLQTIASSMGVALQSARLFDETQRLLKETERRSAELAVINSVQEGVARELNFQGIVDVV